MGSHAEGMTVAKMYLDSFKTFWSTSLLEFSNNLHIILASHLH